MPQSLHGVASAISLNFGRIAAFVFLLGFALFAAVSALAVEPRIYVTNRTPTPPKLDGKLDDVEWNAVEWAGEFTQREPKEGAPPSGQTQFKILYDDDNLYLAYRALDPEPNGVRSVLSRRDQFPGDWVEVNIDSYHDHRTAFSFTASVSGTQGDEFVSNDGDNWDGNWDPVWEHATQIDPEGWSAEVRIPMSQLRYNNRDEHVWGIQVQRRMYRLEERSVWQPIPKDTVHAGQSGNVREDRRRSIRRRIGGTSDRGIGWKDRSRDRSHHGPHRQSGLRTGGSRSVGGELDRVRDFF
jgi:hypothetical protein